MNNIMLTQNKIDDLVIFVQGVLDYKTCLDFQKLIKQYDFSNETTIILNCSELTTLDGCGLGVIVDYFIYMRNLGKIVYFEELNGQPQQLFQTLEIERFVTNPNQDPIYCTES